MTETPGKTGKKNKKRKERNFSTTSDNNVPTPSVMVTCVCVFVKDRHFVFGKRDNIKLVAKKKDKPTDHNFS